MDGSVSIKRVLLQLVMVAMTVVMVVMMVRGVRIWQREELFFANRFFVDGELRLEEAEYLSK